MKFANREVMDLLVFDLNENMIANLDTLKESKLFRSDDGLYYLIAKDALLDENILKFLGTEEVNVKSDMQFYLTENKDGKTITFNSDKTKQCKLLAITLGRQDLDHVDKKFIFEFPNVEIINDFTFDGVCGSVTAFDLVFKIKKYNENGDVFKLHIKG
jgi:hypothetical protein